MKKRLKILQIACGVGLFLSLSLPTVFAQTWNVNAAGKWSAGSNWSGGTAPNGIGATATLGSIITANRTVTVDSNVTLGTLNINDNNSYTLSKTTGAGRTLTFNAAGTGPAQINILGSGSPTISGSKLGLSLTDATVINHTGTGLFTISSVIGGGGSLTHDGTGTTLLSGSNTYTGGLTINGGTLEARNAAALGTTAAGTVVNSGGTLALGGGITITGETLSLAGVGAGGSGALRNAGSNNNFRGNITLTANAGIANSVAGTTLTIGNTSFTNWINTTAAGYTATFDGPGDIWLNSAITGTGTLTTTGPGNVVKNGSGTLTFYADENWYTGSTTVNDGALVLDTLSGLNGAIKGTVVNVGDGTGAGGSAVLRNGPLLSPIANEMINDSATVTFRSDGLYDVNTHQETIGALDFTGGEARTGTGGSLGIAVGSPAAAITSHASSTTALIDATGGDLRLNGSRTFTVADGTAATDLEVRGSVADGTAASGVTKTGSGRLSFTGTTANTYTGPTTVNGGTLELAKSSGVASIAGSAITVNTGGTLLLGSSNQINDSANLTLAGGTLSTGETVGFSETLGTLTLSGTSSIDLGTAAHMLNFADSSALSGIWSGHLTIYGWTGLPEISGTSGQISFGSTVGGLTSGQLAMISFNGFGPGSMLLTSGELVPVAVPEAEAVVAAALLALLVAWRERRRLGA